MSYHKTMKNVIIGVIVVGAICFGVFTYTHRQMPEDQGTACTMEAKICPDGSSVGRTGPNCEFAQCRALPVPATQIEKDTGPIEQV